MYYKFLFCFLISLTTANLPAQPNLPSSGRLTSFSVGLGIINELVPEGFSYRPLFLTYRDYLYTFPAKGKHTFYFYMEPQLAGALNAISEDQTKLDFEFGINLGVKFDYEFGLDRFFFLAIGVGPHYFSTETSLQARGFLFSDNIEGGVGRVLKNGKTRLDVKYRFRHLSNAGGLEPNKGVDNHFLMLEVSRVL